MQALEMETTPFIATQENRQQYPFWPAAVEILQNQDRQSLTDAVTEIARIAPNVNQEIIAHVIPQLEVAYADIPRDFTVEPEINHALQVGLLVAHAVGVENLTTEQFVASLGHDYYENTDRPLSDIVPKKSPHVDDWIIALSHKKNGERIYDKGDKLPYFRGIISTSREYPEADLTVIKACDQIAVANSPLTEHGLKNPSLVTGWNAVSAKKIGEMQLFLRELNNAGMSEGRAAALLNQAIPFTTIRVDSVKRTPREVPLLIK